MARQALTISFLVFLLALASAVLSAPTWFQATLAIVGLPGAVAAVHEFVRATAERR